MSCCDLPPVQADYTPKGDYVTVSGLKTYAVGPADAKTAVVIVYDIFGYSPQILQGADLVASQGNRVYMPDFLLGDYATGDMFAPGGEAKKAAWFSKFPATFPEQVEPITKAIAAIRAEGHSKIAGVGYCWGYKALIEQGVKGIDAFVGVHPSFSTDKDGERIDVPTAILSTQAEDTKIMEAIHQSNDKKNPGKNVWKHYADQPHGFAAARGDVSGGAGTDAFVDAYKRITKFLKDTF